MSKPFLRMAVAMFAAGALGAPATRAAEPAQPDAAKADGKPDMVEKRMREKEPMSGGMKREGMMKEDVRIHAEKKDRMMREAMKKEETEKEQAKK
jgi:hypothetical protein